jgi:hypothetical protein
VTGLSKLDRKADINPELLVTWNWAFDLHAYCSFSDTWSQSSCAYNTLVEKTANISIKTFKFLRILRTSMDTGLELANQMIDDGLIRHALM